MMLASSSGAYYCVICSHIATILLFSYSTDFIDAFELVGVEVPQDYEIGSKDPLVLKCIYEISSKDDENLNYLKWYFNGYPICQWIYPDNLKPFRDWKNIIDTNYVASVNDSMKKFSALRISAPAVNLTGTYGCTVEVSKKGLPVEDSKEDDIIIYEPAKAMLLETRVDNSSNEMEVSCNATGLKPQPEMQMKTNNQRLNVEKRSENASILLDENERYEIIIIWTVNLDQLNESTTFNCTLSIPNTRYRLSKTYDYVVTSDGNVNSTVSEMMIDNSTKPPKDNDSGAGKSTNVNIYLQIWFIMWSICICIDNLC